MEEDLKTFKALEFFPVNEKYFVNAKFEKAKNEKVFEMKTWKQHKLIWQETNPCHPWRDSFDKCLFLSILKPFLGLTLDLQLKLEAIYFP